MLQESKTKALGSGIIMTLLSVIAAALPMGCGTHARAGDSPGISLVEKGRAGAVVVTADTPGPTAEYAVKELVEHVRKATGVTLPVAPESQIPSDYAHRIFVGVTAAARAKGIDPATLANNAFLLRTIGPDLYILGNDDGGNPLSLSNSSSGTLFGVYEILERVVGARWLWPGELGTYVPAASSLRVGELDETVKPKLRWISWSIPNRQPKQYDHDRSVFVRRHRVCNRGRIPANHFFSGWWERYGEKHPEWFQLNSDGTRGPGEWSKRQTMPNKQVHMCVSNKELQRYIGENYAPKGPIFRAKGPGGKPAVHFAPGSRMAIDGFSYRLAGKSFTVMVNSVSDSPDFGLSGNWAHGGGDSPRLLLTPSVYAYDALVDAKGQRLRVPVDTFAPGKESVYAYVYDAQAKAMRLFMNGALIGERQGVETVSAFPGGALAIPFRAEGKSHDGYLLDLAVFDHALSAPQIAAATSALQAGTALPSAGITLQVAARDLDKPGVDGKPVSRWPSAIGPSFEIASKFDLSNADNPEYCLCADCMAMDGPQPEKFPSDFAIGTRIVTDRYVKFMQQIYEMAKENNPDVRVVGFIYRETFPAPSPEIKLNKNFYGEFTPHVKKTMFFPMPEDSLAYIKAQWLSWQKTGMTVGYWSNYFWGGYVFPFLSIRQSAECLKFAYAHGMAGWHGCALHVSWALRGPMIYAHMRLLQDPDLSIDTVLGEYYSAFGPGAEAVARFFDYWEKFSQKIVETENWPNYGGMGGQVQASRIYTPEVLAPAADMLRQAMAEARKSSNPEFARRVQFLQDGLEEARLTLRLFSYLDTKFTPPLGDKKAFEATVEARRQLVEFQRQHAADYLSDYHFYEADVNVRYHLYQMYAKSWQKLDQTLAAGFDKAGGKENIKGPWAPWQFRKDPDDIGVQKEWFRADHDPKEWTPIKVPALWSLTTVQEYKGYAWCRTSFRLPASWKGESISLTFGAVDEQAWVYVNGVLVAEHSVASEKKPVEKLWEEPFAVEIKPQHLKYGAVNSLVVRIHNALGDGGIYRPVNGSTVGTEPLFALPVWK